MSAIGYVWWQIIKNFVLIKIVLVTPQTCSIVFMTQHCANGSSKSNLLRPLATHFGIFSDYWLPNSWICSDHWPPGIGFAPIIGSPTLGFCSSQWLPGNRMNSFLGYKSVRFCSDTCYSVVGGFFFRQQATQQSDAKSTTKMYLFFTNHNIKRGNKISCTATKCHELIYKSRQ